MSIEYVMGKRGCGYRFPGGLYLECGLSPHGKPVEWFFADPPQPITGIDLAAQGVMLIDRVDASGEKVYHVLDWVGQGNYPDVADFLEEVRLMGVSRRVSERVHVELLTSKSRLLLVHAKAIVRNAHAFHLHLDDALRSKCGLYVRAGNETHLLSHGAEIPCSRDWYALDGDVALERSDGGVEYRRSFKSVATYPVWPPAPDAPAPECEPGIFAAVPITRFAVVKAPDGRHEEVAKRVASRNVQLPTDIVDA